MERTDRRPDETPPEADSTETRRDWEPIQENGPSDRTERIRIQGGWLYRTVLHGAQAALAFVPRTAVEDDERNELDA
jgi:hypothetical protein